MFETYLSGCARPGSKGAPGSPAYVYSFHGNVSHPTDGSARYRQSPVPGAALGEDINTASASCSHSISSWCSLGEFVCSLWCEFPIKTHLGLCALHAQLLETTPGLETGKEPSDRWCSIDWWLWGELRSSAVGYCTGGLSWMVWGWCVNGALMVKMSKRKKIFKKILVWWTTTIDEN